MPTVLRHLPTLLCCMAVASCGRVNRAGEVDANRLGGRFFHTTGVGGEIREISLPSGEILARMSFPISGVGSLENGLSNCGDVVLATLHMGGNKDGIYAIDLHNKTRTYLRDGWWPVCGPNQVLFFFAYEKGMRGSGLYVAPLQNPSKATLLINGGFGLPQQLVFVGKKFMATYDPSTESEVVFEFTSEGLKKVWVGGNCQPAFWRSKTNRLVCEDADGAYRSQVLFHEPDEILIDANRERIRGVLHYWPREDVILSTAIRATWNLREYQDLVAIDLKSKKSITLVSHVDINVFGFTLAGSSGSPHTESPDETSPSHTAK